MRLEPVNSRLLSKRLSQLGQGKQLAPTKRSDVYPYSVLCLEIRKQGALSPLYFLVIVRSMGTGQVKTWLCTLPPVDPSFALPACLNLLTAGCQLSAGRRLSSSESSYHCPVMVLPAPPWPHRCPHRYHSPAPQPGTDHSPAAALQWQQRRLCCAACPICGDVGCCPDAVSGAPA